MLKASKSSTVELPPVASLISPSTSSTATLQDVALALSTRSQKARGLSRRLLRQQSLRWYAMLAVVELVFLFAIPAIVVAMLAWLEPSMPSPATPAVLWQSLIFAGTVWLVMVTLAMYQRHGRRFRTEVAGTALRVLIAVSFGALVLLVAGAAASELWLGLPAIASIVVIGMVLLGCTRFGFSILTRGDRLKRRALFLGAGQKTALAVHGKQLESELRSVRITGFIPLPSDRLRFEDSRRIALEGPLLDYARDHGIDDIVIASDELRNALPMNELMSCRLAGVNVLDLEAFSERELGRVTLEFVLPSWFVFTHAFDQTAWRRLTKRSFDLVVASALLVLSLPIMGIAALAIWIESGFRESVFYRQSRVGEGDQTFALFKLRSMRPDAEGDGVARWAQTNDDRITRVGRIIRATRLDELPQLWNVLRGEMSIVGPRPERPEFVRQLEQRIPYYRLRHSIQPGLTGWAQLRYPYGASVSDAMEKLRYDLYYIKHQGFRFDLQILLQTVEVVLFGRGAR